MGYHFFSSTYLSFIFENASLDDLADIYSFLIKPTEASSLHSSLSREYAVVALTLTISQLAQNSSARKLRSLLKKPFDREPCSYVDTLVKLQELLKLGDLAQFRKNDIPRDLDYHAGEIPRRYIYCAIEDVEDGILQHFASALYGRLSSDQRQEFLANVGKHLDQESLRSMRKSAGAGGALLIGNLGGFATYTTLSSLLSTVSMGTLGFGAYTAASSALSFVLGPAGWAALGAYVLYNLGNPDMKKLACVAMKVAMIRHREDLVFYERDTTYDRK